MFQSYLFRINLNIIFLSIIYVLLCLIIKADGDDHRLRSKRAIGGESLDTSNFVLYVDPNNLRYIEVPTEYMNNWLDDLEMWRKV